MFSNLFVIFDGTVNIVNVTLLSVWISLFSIELFLVCFSNS